MYLNVCNCVIIHRQHVTELCIYVMLLKGL